MRIMPCRAQGIPAYPRVHASRVSGCGRGCRGGGPGAPGARRIVLLHNGEERARAYAACGYASPPPRVEARLAEGRTPRPSTCPLGCSLSAVSDSIERVPDSCPLESPCLSVLVLSGDVADRAGAVGRECSWTGSSTSRAAWWRNGGRRRPPFVGKHSKQAPSTTRRSSRLRGTLIHPAPDLETRPRAGVFPGVSGSRRAPAAPCPCARAFPRWCRGPRWRSAPSAAPRRT